MINMKNKIIKLTKTEVNELLKQISIDEPKYGLILKLQYIYGRNISEVYNLKNRCKHKRKYNNILHE